MGLLYGDRQMEDTIVISMRCGQDSDCNPSNAGGVLGTTMGKSKMTPKFVSELNPDGVFSHTAYSFPALVEVCEKLARQAVVKYGGRIEKTDDGDVFVIPVQEPKPTKLEQCWEPGPAANSRFTKEEMKQIDPPEEAPRRTQSAPKIDKQGEVVCEDVSPSKAADRIAAFEAKERNEKHQLFDSLSR